MELVEFRPSQRRTLLITGWICVVIAAGGIAAFATARGSAAKVLIVPGVIGLVIASITLNIGYARTVLTPRGIRTTRPVTRHSARWNEVLAIDTEKVQGSGSGRGRSTYHDRVVIRTAGGGHFRLAAPYDSSNGHDPQFYDKVTQIRRYLARV